MTAFMTVILLATLSQVLVERLKPLFVGSIAKYYPISIPYLSMVVSILVAVVFHVDMFEILGLTIYVDPIVAYIMTGIIISGGASVVNDLFKSIQNLKSNTAPRDY